MQIEQLGQIEGARLCQTGAFSLRSRPSDASGAKGKVRDDSLGSHSFDLLHFNWAQSVAVSNRSVIHVVSPKRPGQTGSATCPLELKTVTGKF